MLTGTVDAPPLALTKKRKKTTPRCILDARKKWSAPPTETERRTKAAAAIHAMLANPSLKSLQRTFETEDERRGEERELKYLIESMGIERTIALGTLPDTVVLQRIG